MDIAHHGLEALTKLQNQSMHTLPSTSSGEGGGDGGGEGTVKEDVVNKDVIDYYDLCLLDFLMPVMSGVDCLTQVLSLSLFLSLFLSLSLSLISNNPELTLIER